MSITPNTAVRTSDPVELRTGDRMTREEFHRLYEQMPENFRAELIGGIVYVSSPLGTPHSTSHPALSAVLFAYASSTAGVELGDNGTILLGEQSEPQPDLYLRILPAFGGQSRDVGIYVQGAPELIAEVAFSSRAIDLHAKQHDYQRHGVLEYLVLSVRENRLLWFDLHDGRELKPDHDGVLRIRSFPGLWIHEGAVLARDFRLLMEWLERGLATPEHAAFVQRLAAAKAAGGSIK